MGKTQKVSPMEKEIVVKENQLVNARYKLNPIELKLVLYAIANIEKDAVDFWRYTLKLADLAIDHKELKRAARSLVSKVFEIKEPDGWLMISWFSSIRYNGKTGTIELQFDPNLKPYLLQLKANFTAYNLQSVLPMRSSYSIRLYELLKQYESIGHRTFNLDELRDILRVPDSYTWKDFKRQILDKAMEEINAHADIVINYQPIKTGRAFTDVSFIISPKDEEQGLKLYIERVRRDRVHQTLAVTKDKRTGKPIELSVDENGRLYNKRDPHWKITKGRALKIWKELYRQELGK